MRFSRIAQKCEYILSICITYFSFKRILLGIQKDCTDMEQHRLSTVYIGTSNAYNTVNLK